jgi:hypothetical protein
VKKKIEKEDLETLRLLYRVMGMLKAEAEVPSITHFVNGIHGGPTLALEGFKSLLSITALKSPKAAGVGVKRDAGLIGTV